MKLLFYKYKNAGVWKYPFLMFVLGKERENITCPNDNFYLSNYSKRHTEEVTCQGLVSIKKAIDK